ncbi:MAG: c-type cytochrome [Solirubrobacteraceae bacterium]
MGRTMIRAALAVIVVAIMGAAILGIGLVDAPADKEPAPSAAQHAAAKQRTAAGGATVRAGRQAFEDEGCDRCHSIAAIGADGKLGPRLDALDDDSEDIAESITDPRDDITDGYEEELMPTDYGEELDPDTIRALAAFIAAASGREAEDSEDFGEGRGRGRGRSGRGGGDDG